MYGENAVHLWRHQSGLLCLLFAIFHLPRLQIELKLQYSKSKGVVICLYKSNRVNVWSRQVELMCTIEAPSQLQLLLQNCCCLWTKAVRVFFWIQSMTTIQQSKTATPIQSPSNVMGLYLWSYPGSMTKSGQIMGKTCLGTGGLPRYPWTEESCLSVCLTLSPSTLFCNYFWIMTSSPIKIHCAVNMRSSP